MKSSEQLQCPEEKQISIDEQLVLEGIEQLGSEIRVLENWLRELEAEDAGNSEVLAARKSYHDMLRSRREMVSALNRHAKNGVRTGKA